MEASLVSTQTCPNNSCDFGGGRGGRQIHQYLGAVRPKFVKDMELHLASQNADELQHSAIPITVAMLGLSSNSNVTHILADCGVDPKGLCVVRDLGLSTVVASMRNTDIHDKGFDKFDLIIDLLGHSYERSLFPPPLYTTSNSSLSFWSGSCSKNSVDPIACSIRPSKCGGGELSFP